MAGRSHSEYTTLGIAGDNWFLGLFLRVAVLPLGPRCRSYIVGMRTEFHEFDGIVLKTPVLPKASSVGSCIPYSGDDFLDSVTIQLKEPNESGA